MKPWAALFCIVACCTLPAQGISELPELQTPALADSAWTSFYESLEQLSQPIKLSARLYSSQSGTYTLASALYKLQQSSLLLNYRLGWEDGSDRLGFRLGIHAGKFRASLGSYRWQFGSGLLSGSGNRTFADSLFTLKDPVSPAKYTPLGVGFTYGGNAVRGGLFASMQKRDAVLEDGAITRLPVSKEDLATYTQEGILGASLGYLGSAFKTALLLYWQQYDRPFAEVDLKRDLWAASICASLKLAAHSLEGELAQAAGKPFGSAAWSFAHKRFSQKVSLARNGTSALFPYALSAGVLDSTPERFELAYSAGFILPANLHLELRYGVNSGSLFDGESLSRLGLALWYRKAGNALRLALYSFDREVITLVDSTYTPTSPRNLRFQLAGKYIFKPNWYQQLECSYHIEDTTNYRKNTYRFNLMVGYEGKKLQGKAGLLSWQSPRSFLVEDDFSPEYISICTSEDTAVHASLATCGKTWSFSLSAQKSLLSNAFQSSLQLGLSIF